MGYTDDLVVLAQGKYNNVVRRPLLTEEERLVIVALTKKTKLEGLGLLKRRGEKIHIKCKGVILDYIGPEPLSRQDKMDGGRSVDADQKQTWVL